MPSAEVSALSAQRLRNLMIAFGDQLHSYSSALAGFEPEERPDDSPCPFTMLY